MMYQRIKYTNLRTNEAVAEASKALAWHNAGDDVEVLHCIGRSYAPERKSIVKGAAVTKHDQDQENFEHCKSIAENLEAYANGEVYQCPDCDEVIFFPDGVGDKFKCPHCGEVHDVEDFEQLGLYDYFEDMLDIEYLVNSNKEYKACKICVAYGGPSVYIDTETCNVELYWWGSRANYRILRSVVDAVDEWAEEYYNCL